MIKKWKLLESKEVFKSSFITLLQEKLEKPDGTIVPEYYSIKRRDVVYVVALTNKSEAVLVYQYKNGVKDLIWELPAGFVEDGEKPVETAARELLEETGFKGETADYLGAFTAAAGSSGNQNHFYLVRNAKKVAEQSLDEHEEIEVKLFNFQDLVTAIKKRKTFLVDSQSQLALLLTAELVK